MSPADRFRRFRIKLVHWEYWPFGLVHFLPTLYWVWLMIRSRSWFFFGSANPGIRYSGFLMESKKEIYQLIPEEYYPKTVLIDPGKTAEECLDLMTENGLSFPLVAKPDIGLKGKRVRILQNESELEAYAGESRVPFLLQALIPYANEIGLFYYRMPGASQGRITGIVKKEFLSVTGDGSSSVETLIRKQDRAFLQLPGLRKEGKLDLTEVLPTGEKKILVPYGNHARGALFLDHSHRITPQLEEAIHGICRQIEGFYFGRLDLRYRDWDSLCKGHHLQIVELNGAGSEPTHIYDPSHSLFFAWKEIIRHLRILYRVSLANRKLNHPGLSFRQGLRMFRENRKQMRRLAG